MTHHPTFDFSIVGHAVLVDDIDVPKIRMRIPDVTFVKTREFSTLWQNRLIPTIMDLLRNALDTICQLANSYLENLDRRDDGWITLTNLVDHNGSLNQDARDKIVMSVYNITREVTVSTYQRNYAVTNGSVPESLSVVNPPLFLDIHIMFMANFVEKKYGDGLAILSRLIGFFQQTPYFNQANAPGLIPPVDKLTLELENLSPVDVNYVMGMLGTRYLPSAFYKLRMIPFASTAMAGRAFPVTGTGSTDPTNPAGAA